IRPAELAAVLLTVIAVILIVTSGNGLAHRQSVLLGVLSGISFGLFIIVLKTLGDTPPAGLFFWTNLSAAAIIIPAGLASGVAFPTAPREIALMATMGIFQLGLAYYFFQRGLAHTRAVEASLIVLLEPILNPIWVYLVLGEMPGARVAMACGLIALALVAMAVLPNRRR
ncbi:MAG: DMT family transporter, partial [Armatimonadota bacterium]|nr:DMT family transporter [Armatimonadota bacterium]